MSHFDLRLPTIVVVGQWNPAIFAINWVAKNLFGKAVGAEVEVMQVVENANPARPIFYLDRVGIRCSEERFEVFVRDFQKDTVDRAEAVVRSALSVLAHTPISGVGVNFDVKGASIPAELSDKIQTNEDLQSKFKIRIQELRTEIETQDGENIILFRHLASDGFWIEVNYRVDLKEGSTNWAETDLRILDRKRAAERIISELYGMDDLKEVGH